MFNTQLHLQDEPYKRKTETVREKRDNEDALELFVCVVSRHLCETLQLSTLPGIRNQTQSHLTSREWRSVTENMYTHTHMHAQAPEEQSNRTHTLPQASREEGSKGWWSHSTPTVNLPVTHCELPSAFTSVTFQNE